MKTTPKAQLRPLAATPQLRTRGPNSLETSPPATFSTPQIGRGSPGSTPKLSDFRLEMQQAKANLDEQMAFTRAKALDASTAPTSMQRRASRGGGVSSTASRAAALASHDGKRLAACQTSLSSDRLALPVVRSPGKGPAAGSGAAAAAAVNAAAAAAAAGAAAGTAATAAAPSSSSDTATTPPRPRGRPADGAPQPRQGIAPFPEERLLELLPSPEKGRSSAAADAAATPAAPAAAPSPAQPRATRGERRGSSSSDATAGARARERRHTTDGSDAMRHARAALGGDSEVTPPTVGKPTAAQRAAGLRRCSSSSETSSKQLTPTTAPAAAAAGARMGRSASDLELRALGSSSSVDSAAPPRAKRVSFQIDSSAAQQIAQEVGADADDDWDRGRP